MIDLSPTLKLQFLSNTNSRAKKFYYPNNFMQHRKTFSAINIEKIRSRKICILGFHKNNINANKVLDSPRSAINTFKIAMDGILQKTNTYNPLVKGKWKPNLLSNNLYPNYQNTPKINNKHNENFIHRISDSRPMLFSRAQTTRMRKYRKKVTLEKKPNVWESQDLKIRRLEGRFSSRNNLQTASNLHRNNNRYYKEKIDENLRKSDINIQTVDNELGIKSKEALVFFKTKKEEINYEENTKLKRLGIPQCKICIPQIYKTEDFSE